MGDPVIVVSCEHGGNHIPKPYRALFKNQRALLDSHRGYDPGALELAGMLANDFGTPLFAARISRLLVDLNRSIGHPRLFSEITRSLATPEKNRIIETYYTPHRQALQEAIAQRLGSRKTVVHIATHSFTPVLDGKVRTMDLGFLYDPQAVQEKRFCRLWKRAVLAGAPELQIRFNAPYRGVSDGLTTFFRQAFAHHYLGLELEVNQRLFARPKNEWKKYGVAVITGLRKAVAAFAARQ